MKHDPQYMIQFFNEEVILDLVEQTADACKYELRKFSYHTDTDERATLTFTIELRPATEIEKRSLGYFNVFVGKSKPKEI